MKRIFFSFLFLLPVSVFPQADTLHFSDDLPVVFRWNANIESDLAGYKLYWDTNSGAPYANSLSVGNVLSKSVTLVAGLWFAALTASDATGNESGYSAELVFYVDTTAAGGATTDSITVKWNRPARYDNGEILPPENIDHYDVVAKLYTEPDWNNATVIKSNVTPSNVNPISAEIGLTLPDGTYYVAVYCYTDEGVITQGVLSEYRILVIPVQTQTRKSLGSTRVLVIPR